MTVERFAVFASCSVFVTGVLMPLRDHALCLLDRSPTSLQRSSSFPPLCHQPLASIIWRETCRTVCLVVNKLSRQSNLCGSHSTNSVEPDLRERRANIQLLGLVTSELTSLFDPALG